MKYSPKLYAQAFAELAWQPMDQREEARLVENFLKLIERNGDSGKLQKILQETEKALRMKTGRRKVTVETAREAAQGAASFLKSFLKKNDVVEERINPDLIAGIKVTIDEGVQFDGSLKNRLDSLFPNQ